MRVLLCIMALLLLTLQICSPATLRIPAVCIQDNVFLVRDGKTVGRIMAGDRVTITGFAEKGVYLIKDKTEGLAGGEYFRIEYSYGISRLKDIFGSGKYEGDARFYSKKDLDAPEDVNYFLGRSFGMEYADLLRYGIYARHGYIFTNTLLNDVFQGLQWYRPDVKFNENTLNGYESKNIVLLKNSRYVFQGPSRDGLAAEWLFNGDARDTGPCGNNGTVTGAVLVSDRFGHPGSAYHFDGEDNVIIVPHSPTLNFQRDFTFAVWFRPGRFNTKEDALTFIYKIKDNNSEFSYVFRIDKAIRRIQMLLSSGGGWQAFNSSAEVPLDRWTFAAGVLQSGKFSLYVNGEADISGRDFPGGLGQNSEPLKIGNGLPGQNFIGDLDDIRLYGRALSRDEILALYHENGWTGD